MSTEVTTYNGKTKEQILAMAGQLVGGNNLMPNMYINRNARDRDTGETLPTDVFTFEHKQFGRVFSKFKEAVKFRPYIRKFRYEVYDSTKDATVARTIFFGDFKEEIIADNGLLKAGAVKKGEPARLPDDQKARCKLFVYGTVSFTAMDLKGNEVEVVDYPVFIKLAGMGLFDEYEPTFKKLDRKGKISCLYDLKVSVNTSGKNPVASIEWDNLTKEHPFTPEVYETLTVFAEYIDTENKRTSKKWDMIMKNKATPEELADTTVADPEDALAKDLSDTVVDA